MSLQAAVDRLELVVLSGNSLWVTAQQISNATIDANVHQPAASYQPSADLISQESFLISRLVTGLNEILEISDHLSKPLECTNLNVAVVPSKMSTKPVAPPTVLSINHLRVVYTSIELLWILGISGVVAPILCCTFDWNEAIHPKSLLISKETVSHLSRFVTAKVEPCSALQYTQCIYSIISNSLFNANMLPRNLKRVLVALLVLSRPVERSSTVMLCVGDRRNNPVESASSTNKSAESLLHDICLSDINKSMVVSELRIAIKGPRWMRTAASDLLSEILLSDMGLAAVIRAYLEGATDDVDLLPLQIRVAVLVTSAPTGLLKEEYFTLLSPQIIELIKYAIDSKDVSLQKICVLAIMRISHFKGDICDLHLVRPLTVALLNIDNENPQLSQRSNDQSVLISNSSTVQRSVSSTVSIHIVVNVLHVLLTICPTQQPLLASLERCGVMKPVMALTVFLLTSNRNSPLLPKLQDICRVIFSTTIHTDHIANQLHDVIIHTTRNMFCIDTDGHLTIERRSRRISETQTASAADYAHHLGLQSKEDEVAGKILSPAELLSAKQAQSLKLSASAGINLDEREKVAVNGRGDNVRAPGWEVDDILSMALIAASAEERNTLSKRASLSHPPLPSATPISNTSQSTFNLWDLGMHGSQEDEDSNIEYGRGDDDESEGVMGLGSAHLMLEVSVRAKAAAELLLHTEQSVSNPQSNSRDNGDTDSKSKCDISKGNGLKVAVEGMGERDEIETKVTREGVAAELFICCLQHFLTRPTTGHLHGHLQVQSDRPTTADATATATATADADADASSSHEVNELDRGLSGLVLVLLQAHVPMEKLLEGECKILDIIGTVLKAYAADLEVEASPHQNIGTNTKCVAPSRTDGVRTGPLIEEINDQDIVENILIPVNKQSASFMDAIKSLSSEKEVQNKRAKIDKEIEDVIIGEGEEEKYEDEKGDEDESQKQILSCVLGMLSAILTLGKASRSFKEEEALKALLWPLQIIAYRESDIDLSKLSTDVSLMLLTRSCNHPVPREKANSNSLVVAADYEKNCEVQTLGGRIQKSSVAVEISCNEYTQPVLLGVSSDRHSNHAEFVVQPIAPSSNSSTSSSSSSSSSPSTFTVSLLQLLNEYCSSPEPYMRAMGLHYITTAIGANTQTLSGHDVDIATSSLVALLADSDSYVYLSALTALSRLADVPLMRGRVFKDLLHAFSCIPKGQSMTPEGLSTHTAETSQCDEDGSEGYSVCVSTRHRALIGEALGILLRRAGAAAPPLVPPLVAVCVRVARTRLSKEEEASLEGFADLRTMILIRPIKDDIIISQTAVKDNNGTKPASNLNDKIDEGEVVENVQEQQQHQAATATAATAGDSVFLRQSALSLLADAVVCSGWGASKYLVDIVDIATGVLAMEGIKFSTQASSSARRSAAFLLRHLISGLREKLVTIKDGGLHLKAAYRSLKSSVTTDDPVIVHHCQAALGALDEMMREQLFLSESQLRGSEMPKIGIFKKPVG